MVTATEPRAAAKPHRFLARTFSTARWPEYDELLRMAVQESWVVMGFEDWVRHGGPQGRALILRHDIDQHPATALKMARIEARHELRSTWYFRWRTAAAPALETVRLMGGHVGLHYETLTRLLRERKLDSDEIDAALIEEARAELRREVEEFCHRFGEIRSICAHGDTRVPGVSNQILADGIEPSWFGVEFDAGVALNRHRLGVWLTDRISAEGGWKDGVDPLELISTCQEPILCLTHPNNWCSGASLWSDRLRAGLAPRRPETRAMRTGDDAPPRTREAPQPPPRIALAPASFAAPEVRPFDPIAIAMRRELLRHYYERYLPLTSDAELRTLETNSGLAESRAQTLERVMRASNLDSVRGRDLLDVGCGFGSLALVFAARGARVTALDPNTPRLDVGRRVAEQFHLPVTWMTGSMDAMDVGEGRFDIAVMNNSFCYVIGREARDQALTRTLSALRPGGVLVIRDPKRYWLRDQFTRVPFVGMLPPRATRRLFELLGRNRSHVRLVSGRAACRELRRAEFTDIQVVPVNGRRRLPRVLASHQHLVARRPPS